MSLLIRADAAPSIGAGHVMRTLALAQAWKDAGRAAAAASVRLPPALGVRLEAEGVPVYPLEAEPGSPEDTAATIALARQAGARWIALDGYRFDEAYQAGVKQAGYRVLCLDDYGHSRRYHADLVVNQNLHANEAMYPAREPGTRLLLGPRYALLRREFREWQGPPRGFPSVARRVLVTTGGGDSTGLTALVLRALNDVAVGDLEVVATVGPLSQQLGTLEAARDEARYLIRLECDPVAMPALMGWADLGVSAAGSTSWELAFMGVPSLLVPSADNQEPVGRILHERGAAVSLGPAGRLTPQTFKGEIERVARDPSLRAKLSERGRAMVDGLGARRVVGAMNAAALRLRPAQGTDRDLLLRWRNDPEVRASSFQGMVIPPVEHAEWFARKLRDPNCLILIAEDDTGEPVGQVRFQFDGEEAEVSVSVSGAMRGHGLAGPLIVRALARASQACGLRRARALIKLESVRSRRSFESAGFVECGRTTVKGTEALVYIRELRNESMTGDSSVEESA